MAEKRWTDGETSLWMVLTLLLGLLCGWMTFGVADISGNYKKGQIDALLNNVKYELVIHPDSTRTWEYKK